MNNPPLRPGKNYGKNLLRHLTNPAECAIIPIENKRKGDKKMDKKTESEKRAAYEDALAAMYPNTIEDLKEMPNGDDWGDLLTIGELEGWGGEVW